MIDMQTNFLNGSFSVAQAADQHKLSIKLSDKEI
jgi:hypothetical protein